MASPSTDTANDEFNNVIGTLTTKLAQLKAIDEVAATRIAEDIKTSQDEHESRFPSLICHMMGTDLCDPQLPGGLAMAR